MKLKLIVIFQIVNYTKIVFKRGASFPMCNLWKKKNGGVLLSLSQPIFCFCWSSWWADQPRHASISITRYAGVNSLLPFPLFVFFRGTTSTLILIRFSLDPSVYGANDKSFFFFKGQKLNFYHKLLINTGLFT